MNKNSSKSKTATSKLKKNPLVSKYFQSKKESPNQKSSLNKSDPKNKFDDSADDFRSPMPIPKKRNLTWKLNKPKQKTTKKSKSKAKNCTLSIIKDNFEGGDENPEHLQMAIALSKSSYEAEYKYELQNNEPDIAEILQNVKPTNLERFGFKKNKPTMEVECRNLQKPEISRKGKGRSKYITPVLDIRSPQDRESIIESKITFILNQPNIVPKQPSHISLTSLKLQEFKSENCTIFGLDNLYRENCFYVEDLVLEKNQHKCCGFLLKDWSSIPGRDKSPTKTPSNNTETTCKSPLKEDICMESQLEQKSSQIESGINVSSKKLSRSQKQSPMNQISTNLQPNDIKDDAKSPFIHFHKSSINADIMKSWTLEAKDSGVSSLGQFSSGSLSTNRSISPDLFSSDEEYECPASNENEIQSTSPQIDNKHIKEYKTNSEVSDSQLDDGIPINQSNSSWRPQGFYSLDEFEDNNDEYAPSFWFREQNSDEVLSPKCIVNNTDIEKMGSSNDYSTRSHDARKKLSSQENMTNLSIAKNISEGTVPIATQFGSPKSTASYCQREILHDSFESIATINTESITENLPNFFNEGRCPSQKNIEGIQMSNSVSNFKENRESSCSLPLDLVSFPKSISSNHETCIDLLDTAHVGSTSGSYNSENLVDSNKYLVESEFKENTLTLEEPLEKISKDIEVDCLLSNHSHDDMVDAPDMYFNDETNNAPDLSPMNSNSSSQQNHSCIEILDDSSSDLVYESKPSKSPIFDDYKFDHTAVHETPKKSPTNESTPLTTTRLSSVRVRTSNAFSSADLNVTDYVNQILNKERFSFDNPHIEISEEMPTSQDSQNDFVDEELNYSCHFATPVRPAREVIFKEETITHKPASSEAPLSIIEAISTPNKYIIKTEDITPMPQYDKMATPLLNNELQKMGIKPLKRAKGLKLLKYIYESTHPLVGAVDLMDAFDTEPEGKIIKRRKRKQEELAVRRETVLDDACHNFSIEIVGDLLLKNEKTENLIFERKQSTKIPSCRVPLQIVWHNFLSCNPTIKENILLYEPLHLEFLHELLKEQGFKFHAQDLLTFLDKKCITIRTNQNRGKKHR